MIPLSNFLVVHDLLWNDPKAPVSQLSRYTKFFPMCEAVRALSKHDVVKVGAVALGPDQEVLAVGYNGLPRKVLELPERYHRPLRSFYFAHAEENLIAQAARVGSKLMGSTLLVSPLHPCATCSRMIIQAGVTRVITPPLQDMTSANPRWEGEIRHAVVMLLEASVELIIYDSSNTSAPYYQILGTANEEP